MLFESFNLSAQSFNNFITLLNSTPVNERQVRVDSFMTATSGFPVTEDTLANFVYVGTGITLAVPGDFSGWDPANAVMTHIDNTNFWYRTESFLPATRLDYKIVINNSNWILDPLNPYTAPGGYGDNSELRMPEYIPPAEINFDPTVAHGTLSDTSFYSSNLNNSRNIKIYLPAEYTSTTIDFPVLIVHDGLEYISFAHMDHVLDNMIAAAKVAPLIAVFIPPVNRNAEYMDEDQDAFTSFIVDEMMPWLQSRYRVSDGIGNHGVMGSSAGGNISFWLGMAHPEIFGKIAAFSSFIESDIQNYFENHDALNLSIYMNIGSYDHLQVIHESVEAMVPVLEEKDYDYRFFEFPDSHSYGFWRGHTDEALIFLYPGSEAGIHTGRIDPAKLELSPVFPNPFHNEINIEYQVKVPMGIRIVIMDASGSVLKKLADKLHVPGRYSVQWNGLSNEGKPAAKGVYFAGFIADEETAWQRIVKI